MIWNLMALKIMPCHLIIESNYWVVAQMAHITSILTDNSSNSKQYLLHLFFLKLAWYQAHKKPPNRISTITGIYDTHSFTGWQIISIDHFMALGHYMYRLNWKFKFVQKQHQEPTGLLEKAQNKKESVPWY